jgi:hypothetical protein
LPLKKEKHTFLIIYHTIKKNLGIFLLGIYRFEPVWKKGSLKIIKLVARFLYQLKTKAEKLKIKLMNVHIFNYIDDKGSDYKQFN